MQRVYEGDESRIDATVLYYMVTPPHLQVTIPTPY